MAFDALLIGDIHLDKMHKLYGPQANRLLIHEVDKAFQYAYDNGIPNVVQLGDIGNKSRLSYDAHLSLLSVMFKWDGKVESDWFLGNHDVDELGVNSLEILDLLQMFGVFKSTFIHVQSTQREIAGVDCQFLCWPDTLPLPNANKREPVVFGHFETVGATGDNGRTLKSGVQVPEKYQYYNGHLHTPHTASNVHYVGTLFQTSFGESLPKSMTHLRAKYDGKRLVHSAKRIQVSPEIQLHNLIVEGKSDLRQIDPNPKMLYRLIVEEGVEIHADWLSAHPNVVKIEGWSTKAEQVALVHEEWLPQEDGGVPVINERDLLKGLLTTKYQLPEAAATKAVKLLDKLISRS